MKMTEFKTAWIQSDQILQPVSLQTLRQFDLNTETVDFLLQIGLPSAAAPF